MSVLPRNTPYYVYFELLRRVMQDKSRQIKVLFGTQTGTSEELALQIARECKRRWLLARVISLENYDPVELFNESLVVFVVSTTGQGDIPDNMKSFWRYLMNKRITALGKPLSSLKFAVFGLGDSSYRCFNFAGKKLYRRLEQLGGISMVRRADADYQHKLGFDGELQPWMQDLFDELLKIYPIPADKSMLPGDVLPPPRYIVTTSSSQTNQSSRHRFTNPPSKRKDLLYSKVVQNTRITASDWEQDVRHIILNIDDLSIQFEPGDVVQIHPRNSPTDTIEFLTYMGFDPNLVIESLEPSTDDPNTPSTDLPLPCTLQEIMEGYYDFMGTPRRYFFELLSYFASDSREMERLKELASPEGQEELRWYNFSEHRTAFQVFRDFPSARPPLDYLLDIIPRIQPRSFSISSSLRANPDQIHLTMAVVAFRTKMGRIRKGVCSNFLASLDPKTNTVGVPITVKKGFVHLPLDHTKPIIMVGPGTGCAMFRAFLQERDALKQSGVTIGECAFFFGCRHSSKDYIHESEWKEYVNSGVLTLFDAAFSRDQPQKIYVQHRIKEHSKEVWELISKGGVIYVSGSSERMPVDVREAFQYVIQKEGNMSESQAEQALNQLDKTGRYQEETW